MRVEDVPSALRRQLGPEATDGLLGTLDQRGRLRWAAGDQQKASADQVDKF